MATLLHLCAPAASQLKQSAGVSPCDRSGWMSIGAARTIRVSPSIGRDCMAGIRRERNIGVKPKAYSLDGRNLRRLLARALGGRTQIPAQLCDTGVQRVLTCGVIVG